MAWLVFWSCFCLSEVFLLSLFCHMDDFYSLIDGWYDLLYWVQWPFMDFFLSVEIWCIGAALFGLEWTRALLCGAQWRHCVQVVLTLSQLEHCQYICAFIGVACLAALKICRNKHALGP